MSPSHSPQPRGHDPRNFVVSDFWRQSFDPVAAPFGTYETSKLWNKVTQIAQSDDSAVLGGFVKKLQAPLLKSPKLLLDILYGDLKLRLSPAYYSQERALIKGGRHPEEGDLRFLDGCKGQTINFVDIGANTGYYSLHAAKLSKPDSRIVAIEPDPRNSLKLAFHIQANAFQNRIERLETAIGDQQGTMVLNVPDERDFGQNTLAPVAAGGRNGQAIEIPVQSLLEVLNELQLQHIDYLKIDVEGYEDKALLPFFTQAPRSLWPKQVLMEAKINETWERDVLAEMKSIGYEMVHESNDNIWLALSD